jgi:hypothetical protein
MTRPSSSSSERPNTRSSCIRLSVSICSSSTSVLAASRAATILATLPIPGSNVMLISSREAAPSMRLSSSHASRTTVLSRRAIGRSSFAHVSCARRTHRRSASASWSSRPTTASRNAISRRRPYVSLASSSVASSRTSRRRADWRCSLVSAACAETSCVCSVDIVAAWRALRDSSALCSVSVVAWENFLRKKASLWWGKSGRELDAHVPRDHLGGSIVVVLETFKLGKSVGQP